MELDAPTSPVLLDYVQPGIPRLSPTGRYVLLKTRRANVDKNRFARSRRILPTDPNETPPELDLPRRARSVTWGPNASQLAYLAPVDGTTQVWVRTLGSESARQITHSKKDIRSFEFSPTGDRVAYTIRTRRTPDRPSRDSTRGVEIDLRTFTMWDLQGDQLSSSSPHVTTELWIKDLQSDDQWKVSQGLTVNEYAWSPRGDRLAITGAPAEKRRDLASGVSLRRSDLYLFDRQERRLRQIHTGRQDSLHVFEGMITYSDPFWSPSGRWLGFTRMDWSDRFARTPTVGIYDRDQGSTRYVTPNAPADLAGSRFHWVSRDSLLVDYLDHAERGLYRLSLRDGRTHPVWTPDGEAKGFSFSTDGSHVAWIQGSMEQPPEIYAEKRPFNDPRKITSLNEHLNARGLPEAESITWTSTDGTEVQGWLLRTQRGPSTSPPPLVVFVHGGPAITTRNKFFINRTWPFPFRALTGRGYNVFIPNYRHSKSFGKEFLQVSALDDEPIDDILTGIDHLAKNGLADTTRMGIMGHSHGGWLGPLVAAERPTFEAASFAEGIRANYVSGYGRGSGGLNEDLTQYLFDASPYENLDRSADLSPALRNSFTKTTPTLLEYGKKGRTVNGGIELARAFWHHDTPHELVIYPELGHVNRTPATMLESMKRTLAWIERWIPTGSTSNAQ